MRVKHVTQTTAPSERNDQDRWRTLETALRLTTPGVISIVGAGGKTTLMFNMAAIMAAARQAVLTTTTTKIRPPARSQCPRMVIARTMTDLVQGLEGFPDRFRHVTAGAEYLTAEDKLRGYTTEMITTLWQSGLFAWVIAEADGSAGRPLKWPAGHEPVVGRVTRYVVAVVGLRAVGKPLDHTMVHRPERYAKGTGLAPGDAVTPASVARALLREDGILKGTPPGSKRIIFLNTAGQPALEKSGMAVVESLRHLSAQPPDRIIIGAAGEPPASWRW
ncbi:MAG: selenium cofactor biosynthesis protein YqeC [Desulfobacterales bacterium]